MEPEKIMMKKARFRSLGMAGKHHSEESKRKMSAALKGRKRSEEDKRKMRLGHKKIAHKKRIILES